MPPSSNITARCAALSISIAQVIPDVSHFARKVRDARHDLNAINNDLLIIRTGLGVAQDDFSKSGSKLPTAIIDAVQQVLDSCDDASERLHKTFVRLSFSSLPKEDWQELKDGTLASMRQDLEASRIVLELALEYLALYGQQDTLDSFLKCYVSDLITASDELLKRTDADEIQVNLIARERLPSLLHAIRLLRSCITAIARGGETAATAKQRLLAIRSDSFDPSLGEKRHGGRISPLKNLPAPLPIAPEMDTWLADIPDHQDAQPMRYSGTIQVTKPTSDFILSSKRLTREEMTPSRGTFYTDDGVSTNRTLVAPEPRLKKTRSWCSGLTAQYDARKSSFDSRASRYAPTIASSNASIFHKNITSDKIAVAKAHRHALDIESRLALDRILINLPSDARATDVEKILWEGASPMASHPDFGFFFIRAAYEMVPDVLITLIEFGANIKKSPTPRNRYSSVMHAAALGGQEHTLRYLVSLGHSIDALNNLGETPLIVAMKSPGAYEAAKYLVDMGADVNHESDEAETPLYLALTTTILESRERSRMIELLLSHGAEGDAKRNNGSGRSNLKGRTILGID